MGSLLALLALALFSANIFVVRSASVRLDQQLGFLVDLIANVAFGALLFGADLAGRTGEYSLDMGVWFPPNRGGLLYAASRSGAAVFS